jgi:hypothetical protein
MIQLRDARDRISELLGLGHPYPLRDLPVPSEGLKVPFGQEAKIPVEYSQVGVLYQLHEHEQPVSRPSGDTQIPVEDEGKGKTLHLTTARIEEDVSYQILATKIGSRRKAYLHESATIKVGLDTSLNARIVKLPPLDPTRDPLLPTDPRLADHGAILEVEVERSQAGVDYRLVYGIDESVASEEIDLSASVRGTDDKISLYTRPVKEDMVVRIRATKSFDPSENRETESDLLKIELPLKVKANRALDTRVSPAAIIAYGAETKVRIATTQQSANYRVYRRRISDPEFIHDPAPDSEVLRISLPDEPEVQISRHEVPEPWQPIAKYESVSDYQQGNGGELEIAIGQIRDDSLLMVEARKLHSVSESQVLGSSVWGVQPSAVLVRPNPMPGLNLTVVMQDGATDGRLWVADGQPGVFYDFRTTLDGEPISLPAYFYQRDAIDSRLNKGIGQMEVKIDLVVAADPPADSEAPDIRPASRVPKYPLLTTDPVAADTRLHIRARKAQTQIEAPLTQTALIAALPEIRAPETGVTGGSKARILIVASHIGERYQLMLDGEVVGPALAGDGNDLELVSGPIDRDTNFEVWVTRPQAVDIAVKQLVPILVRIRPVASLALRAVATVVQPNSIGEIIIESSQVGISYQLLTGDSEVGSAISGTGSALRLASGLLTAETIFSVRATRLDAPAVSVVLTQQVKISVQASDG